MFKRITALALCLILTLGLLPAADAFGREPVAPESVDQCCHTLRVDPLDPNYVRPAFDGKLIEVTPQRVEDTFRYLDELYVEKHPEAALYVYTGTEEDQANLLKLAQTVTEGCKTNKEKADAIDRWLARNIYYAEETSAYASDTFYRREGNCLSYANLMQFLLRSLGIPAVVGDGWRGDMKTMGVELFNYAGHAWCFVLLDGEWVLYDPLWLECGTTDRDYMAEWIYFDTVEFICPAYDGDDLPPEAYDKVKAYYTNGKPHLWGEFMTNTVGASFYFVNNQCYSFVSNQCEPDGSQDGIYYLDGVSDKTRMEMGELYRNSWVSYGDYRKGEAMLLAYAFPNGMMIDGAVMEYDGIDWLMYANQARPILADESDYFIADGWMVLRPGYTGPFLGQPWQEGCIDDDCIVLWEPLEEACNEIATVDQNGIITCHKEGWAEFQVSLKRVNEDGSLSHLSGCIMQIFVSNEDRTPDYTDYQPHEHDWVYSHRTEATCEDWGVEYYTCSVCGVTTESWVDAPLGHDHSIVEIIEPTCVSGGYTLRTCVRCGDSYTEDPTEPDPSSHVWNEYDCTLCDATRKTLFDDVVPGQFYEDPVAWAVEKGITNGTSANAFGSNDRCLRAHVVTFLWRAAGCPEPTSAENPFVDVKETDFYYKPVLWAVENGITNGTDATHFGPFGVCNRASVVTFLWRAMGQPEPTSAESAFADVPAGSWYDAPVRWAVENGITNGISATDFGPTSACNRAQVVTFLYRAYN